MSEANDYSIEIDFNKRSLNPENVFRSMLFFIEACKSTSSILVSSINIKIDTDVILSDIQTSSLKTFLADILRIPDDEAVKSLSLKRIIGAYVNHCRHLLTNALSKEEKLLQQKEIDDLIDQLYELARSTDATSIPTYAKLTPEQLVRLLILFNEGASALAEKEEARFVSNEGTSIIHFNQSLFFADLHDLINVDEKTIESEMILRIKKPDLLGSSQWEFKYGNRPIRAKMVDLKWLDEFHNGDILIAAGDSLRARVKYIQSFDSQGNFVDDKYEVIKVINEVKGERKTNKPINLPYKDKE